jgi:hypothetical protein
VAEAAGAAGVAEHAAAERPGNVLVQNLYRRLFRPEPIGPTIVFVITILGGVAGISIWQPAWPLLALAVGGTAAALWRILVGDRSHAADLVAWRYSDITRDWAAMTGLPAPVSADDIRGWTQSDAFRKARPLDQARALAVADDMARAREALARASTRTSADAAAVEAVRFDLDFTERGEGDFGPWTQAVARLDPGQARGHRASMAILEAAFELDRKGPWLITLDKAAAAIGPFEVPPRQRLLRRIFPLLPVLFGISAVAVVTWLFLPAFAA